MGYQGNGSGDGQAVKKSARYWLHKGRERELALFYGTGCKKGGKRPTKPAKSIMKRRLKIKPSFIAKDIIPDSIQLFLWPVQ